ncbi:MAG: hypothetical protein SH820_13080 [Xanthomonadales bacterium]|nr:hypothetical protein [Xanthomonadales bacterium]
MSLFEELKRRNVIRVGIAYIVGSWLLVQGADLVLDLVGADDWVLRAVAGLLALGFIPAVIFAWAFELTPAGVRKESQVDRTQSITPHTARKLDIATMVFVVAAVALLAVDRFLPSVPDPVVGGRSQAPALRGTDASLHNGRLAAENSSPTPSDDVGGSHAAESPAAEIPPEKSIAVLPFVNMSNDPDQEFFSDGISEELLNVLAKYPGVRVAARTSSFQFKGQNQDIGEIARLLKVRNVLEGSVRKSGNKLRITAQLIRADTGYHLWSETYDRELDDVFAIQDEISAAIGEALRVELSLDAEHPVEAPRVTESANTAAYEAFLRGRHLVNQRGRSNILEATEELKRAVRLDPDFAPAQAWMAIAWTMMLDSPSTYGNLSLAEVKERATPHLERALQLNPNLAEAYGAQTMLAMNSSDFATAMSASARALELNPIYIDAMNWRQIAASNYGDYKTSQDIIKRMVEVDPLTIVGRLNYANVLAINDLEAGREMAKSIMAQNPWASYTALGQVEYFEGDGVAASLKPFMQAYGEDPHDELSNRALIQILSQANLFDEARRISDGNLQIVDIAEGQLESAIHSLQLAHAGDPENTAPLTDLADALHLAGRFEESQRYYEQLTRISPLGMVFDTFSTSPIPTIRKAYAYKLAGNSAAAEESLSKHRQDIAKRESLALIFYNDLLAEALAQSVEENEAGVFENIRLAMQEGAREDAFFREPALQWLKDHPEFLALKAEMHQLVMQEQAKILQLICYNNPIPDIWQPLSSTCMGIQAGP